MSKAIIYTRFSPRPNADTCQSCQFQLDACKQYCSVHDLQVIGTFSDEGLSGSKTDNRQGFQDAITAACKHKTALVVHSLSRFARSTKDAIANAELLNKAGADLISLKENIDTTTAMGRFVFTVLAALDELERQRISERTKEAMARHQANHKKISSSAPYGFVIDPADTCRIIPNISEQRVIRIIERLDNRQYSLRKIAGFLNSKNIPARGQMWHHHTIKRIVGRSRIDFS